MNTCYIASTYSSCSVEEIVSAAPSGFRWFQLYVLRKRNLTEQLVQRVEALGFQALVLTADLPYPGKRRDDIRNNFTSCASLPVKNFEGAFEVSEFCTESHKSAYCGQKILSGHRDMEQPMGD